MLFINAKRLMKISLETYFVRETFVLARCIHQETIIGAL